MVGKHSGEIHIFDTAYSRPILWQYLLDSPLLHDSKKIILYTPEMPTFEKASDKVCVNLRDDIATIINALVKFYYVQHYNVSPPALFAHILTSREETILRMYLFGMAVGQIAKSIQLSRKGVYTHLSRTMRKLRIRCLKHLSCKSVTEFLQQEKISASCRWVLVSKKHCPDILFDGNNLVERLSD